MYLYSVHQHTQALQPIHTIELKPGERKPTQLVHHPLAEDQLSIYTSHPGTGPRHLSFVEVNRVRTDMYLICELSNEIIYIQLTFDSNPESIQTQIRQILSTLPKTLPSPHVTYGAGEIHVSSDHRFLYASNRQTDFKKPRAENNMVIFDREVKTGFLKSNPRLLKLEASGFTPRQFSFSLEGHQAYMVVVGQQDDRLSIYSRDSNLGGLRYVDTIRLEKPSVAQFLPCL